MNFQKLKYAIVAADSGSFREAARRLYMAQSSLSTSIKELEEEYQIQIFERTKRGIFITEEGSEFLSYARDILSQVDVLEKRYLESADKTLFSVSGQHYDFASEAFAQLVKISSKENQDFRLLETSTNEVLQDVKNAYSELGIIYMNFYNKKVIEQYLDRYEMQFFVLGEFQPHIFVGKTHPLANRQSVHLEELADYPVISFEQSEGSSAQFTEEALQAKFQNQTVIYNSDRASAINILAVTDAYLIGSGILTSPFKQLMQTIPIEDQEPNVIGYIKVRYRKLSPLAIEFIKIVETMLSTYQKEE